MYLKEMKTLTSIFFIVVLFPCCFLGQSTTFRSNYEYITGCIDTTKSNLEGMQYFSFTPRIYLSSSSVNHKQFYNAYLLGLSFESSFKDRLRLIAHYDYLDGNFNPVIQNYQDSLAIYYPGFGLNNNRFQFNFKYFANKFVTLDFGNGKQFIGDGYRSLLLSDVASSYPYLKLTTEFGPVKYYNLYTTFLNPSILNYGRKKHSTIHYLDFAVTDKIHIGVFESVLWQSKTESAYNGYELAYLNPIIFYRPVEFSKKSNKGNALMGATFNARLNQIMFYGQFLLDDLNISRQSDQDENYAEGFFQNKFGYQLGLKGQTENFKYLIEYNQVQPYTYGHRTILQNYSHNNQALAHPLGANFKEWINILEMKRGRWVYKIKTMFSVVGLDSINTHYGQNIFASDYDASTGGQLSYGNFNGQGFSTSILSFQPEVSFKLKAFDFFASIYYKTKNSDLLDQSFLFYSVGLRTFPFLNIPDY